MKRQQQVSKPRTEDLCNSSIYRPTQRAASEAILGGDFYCLTALFIRDDMMPSITVALKDAACNDVVFTRAMLQHVAHTYGALNL